MSKKTRVEISMERLMVVVALGIATYLSTALTHNQLADDVQELRQLTRAMAVSSSG